jgi:cyclopropane-fatty-acyl-phospholipid synthase
MDMTRTDAAAASGPAGASAAAIRHHYDVSNEFYRPWLGPTMVYSCAMFAPGEGEPELEAAQVRKLACMADWARVAPGDRVLEIGCGWGALLRHLVEARGAAHATGLSLSDAQTAWIRQQPDPRLEVHVESWTDHLPRAPYDAIVSVEALEAFVRPGLERAERVAIYRRLFERCHTWLAPGGHFALQTIAYGNAAPSDLDPFISREIFPESDLPTLAELADACNGLFEVRQLVNEREHYVLTTRAWLARLMARRSQAVARVGEPTVARYERYLRLCTWMFASGSCALYRFDLQRIDRPRAGVSRPS